MLLLPIELAVQADSVWPDPGPQGVSVRLGVRFLNRGASPQRLRLIDTIRFEAIDPKGRVLSMEAARDATRRENQVSEPIASGKTLNVAHPVRLERQGGRWRLTGEDGFGGRWWIDGLTPGVWNVRATYENDAVGDPRGAPVWRGRLVSPGWHVRVGGRAKSETQA